MEAKTSEAGRLSSARFARRRSGSAAPARVGAKRRKCTVAAISQSASPRPSATGYVS